MQILFPGTGSASCVENFHSNMVIQKNNKNLFVDAGGDLKWILKSMNMKFTDIDAIYVSHGHHDHIGGLEDAAFGTQWTPHRITLYVHESWYDELWGEGLKLGLKGIEGRKMSLEDYFKIVKIKDNEEFYWENIKFNTVETLHIYAQYAKVESYGLIFNDVDGERMYITTDCQFAPETAQKAFYAESDVIFHDCETTPFASGVHSHYNQLKTLPTETKAKMWLYHYADNVSLNFSEWQEKAIADGFKGFIKQGAIYSERYGMQLNGTK